MAVNKVMESYRGRKSLFLILQVYYEDYLQLSTLVPRAVLCNKKL